VVPDAQIPYWSHDGKQLGFTYGGWRVADWALNLDAGVVEVDGEARAVGEPSPIVVGYHEDFTPAWSPDGRWIAYHSHRSATPVAAYVAAGTTDDIYLLRTGATVDEEIRLTDFGWEVGMADWAPDGRRLVFDSWDRDTPGVSKPWIATIDPTAGQAVALERLSLPEGFNGTLLAAWSPLGGEIAVVERIQAEQQALWVLGVNGEVSEKLLDIRASTYGGVDWTPDGRQLVYAALSDGRMQLYSLLRSGGQPQQLTRDRASLIQPQVSPDGRWIAATRVYRSKELRRLRL
jgi:Tol biopolymer transport system component